jgi:hypothetical protein
LAQTEFSFRESAVRNINADSDVTNKGAILAKPWYSNFENPSIFSVMPPKAILHPEFLPTIKGLRVGILTAPQVLGVNTSSQPFPSSDSMDRPVRSTEWSRPAS